MERLVVGHEEYDQLCDLVIQTVRDGDWLPDVVLAVSRGGLRLGDALSRALKRPMAVIAASSYSGVSGTEQASLQISASIATVAPLQGRVLLVDDLVDTGITLAELVKLIPSMLQSAVDLKTAVIWVKPHAGLEPDYYAVRLNDNPWIVQPFEQRDFSS